MMKNNLITAYFVPLLGSFVTAYQVSADRIPCIILLVASIIASVYIKYYYKSDRQKAVVALICSFIMLSCSSIGLLRPMIRDARNERWNQSLRDEKDLELDRMIQMVNNNDGPSIIELSDYYYNQQNYKEARYYAQKAADKGNVMGYARLVDIDIKGLGCRPDTIQAVSNMIRAQKVDYFIYVNDSSLIRRFSLSQKQKLDETLRQQQRLKAISNILVDASKKGGDKLYFKKMKEYHDELYTFALDGYAPALEYLYTEALLDPNSDALQLYEYAEQLYEINRIPTSPIKRHLFLRHFYENEVYSLKYYKSFIELNDYIIPAFYSPDYQDSIRLYTDTLLLRENQLFLAQYKWYKGLVEGTIPKRRFTYDFDVDYEDLLEKSRLLLYNNINGINYRINHYDEYLTVDDPKDDQMFKLNAKRRWPADFEQ